MMYAALRVCYFSVFHYLNMWLVASAHQSQGGPEAISQEKKLMFSDPGCLLVKTTF